MKARSYNIRIDIYENLAPTADGYGGNIVSSQLISSSWAKKEDAAGNRVTDYGLTNITDPVLFKLRKRNDLPYNGRNLYVAHNGFKYVIQGIKEQEQEVEILCQREAPVDIPLIGVIGESVITQLTDTIYLSDETVLA